MWNCVKCETNNEDSQAVCGICGMKMTVSGKIWAERRLNEKKTEPEFKTAADNTAEKKSAEVHNVTEKNTMIHGGTSASSYSGSVGKTVPMTRLEEIESSLESVDTFPYEKKRLGMKALQVVMIIVAILLLVVIAAVCMGIFVLF